MSKGLKGFIIGLVLLAITFCVVVLIVGSCHGLNFVEEIQSWFPKAPEVEETVETALSLM